MIIVCSKNELKKCTTSKNHWVYVETYKNQYGCLRNKSTIHAYKTPHPYRPIAQTERHHHRISCVSRFVVEVYFTYCSYCLVDIFDGSLKKASLPCSYIYISINVHLRAVLCLLCNLRPRFTVALYAKSMSVFERARAFLNMWVIVHICAAWGRAPEPEPNVYILNVICAREGHVWSLRSDLHIRACLDRRVWCGACAMCVVSVSVP